MSKYQEALYELASVPLYKAPKPNKDGFVEHSHLELKYENEINLLQELVDKNMQLRGRVELAIKMLENKNLYANIYVIETLKLVDKNMQLRGRVELAIKMLENKNLYAIETLKEALEETDEK